MEIDMQKLDTAITYVHRIAEGHNPINNMPADEDSVLNNANVIRCMYFVEEVLKAVYDNGGVGKERRKKSTKILEFPYEALSSFVYREDQGINKLIDQIYEPVQSENYKKITGKQVNDWLVLEGYLEEKFIEEFHKNVKLPTEKGLEMGLRAERVEYSTRSYAYIKIVYGKQAQEFIITNIEKIVGKEKMS